MRLRKRPAPPAAALALAVVLSGCGGGSGSALSAATRAQLTPLVHEVRRAAESLDRAGARRALTNLQRAVAEDQQRGDISPASAVQILSAAAGVESRLVLVPTTTTTVTTTTTTTTQAPPPAKGHDDKKKAAAGTTDRVVAPRRGQADRGTPNARFRHPPIANPSAAPQITSSGLCAPT